ncbi:MAG: hypothetical protein QM813_15690 [Verrucomicrobiota bacterium]
MDVSGWYLTDNATMPKKYRIPAEQQPRRANFYFLTTASLTSGTEGNTAFAFSSTGEEVYLFTSANTNAELTGYSHGFAFGAVFNGRSFGRAINSAGVESFPLQRAVTLGTTNAGPQIGPIVINEIHYHPSSPTEDEFIELLNTGDTIVTGYIIPISPPTPGVSMA